MSQSSSRTSVARYFRQAIARTAGTVSVGLRPWGYRNVMAWTRQDLELWDTLDSYDGLVPDLGEEPWWRDEFAAAAARTNVIASRFRHRMQRWITVGLVAGLVSSVTTLVMFTIKSPASPAVLLPAAFAATGIVAGPAMVVSANSSVISAPYLLALPPAYGLAVFSSLSAGRPDLLFVIDPASLPLVPAALTLAFVITAIGAVITSVLNATALAASKRLTRSIAQSSAAIEVLRIAAALESSESRRGRRDAALREARRICQAAGFLEKGGPQRGPRLLNDVIAQKLSFAARRLRFVAVRVVLGSSGPQTENVLELRRVALCLLLGLYERLDEPERVDDLPLTLTRPHRGVRWLAWFTATVLPLLAVAAVPLFGLDVPDVARQWFTAAAVIWAAVRVVTVLEPDYRASVQAALDLIGTARNFPGKS